MEQSPEEASPPPLPKPLSPLEKLKELLEAWLDRRITLDLYKSEINRIRLTLNTASAQLRITHFPESYLPGPVLKQVGAAAFDTFGQALDLVMADPENLQVEHAQQALDLASKAVDALEQAMAATKNLRMKM